MAFIQIIEVTTTRPQEIQELVDEWSAKTEGRRTVYRSTFTADRDGLASRRLWVLDGDAGGAAPLGP